MEAGEAKVKQELEETFNGGAPRAKGFFRKAAVTLFLWGPEFTRLQQQSSGACNAEGILSTGILSTGAKAYEGVRAATAAVGTPMSASDL
ncbi:hypothetical protein EYF80_051477 [Liparis tanakae]|uniref:Uncharacterized protein n=1 Tax=Liparis tanakae TaxID=230148 RepID=A0A4Z2FB03_9TELE|nr:hypothetical protein EYF80_051477 [Liparis tanakae]